MLVDVSITTYAGPEQRFCPAGKGTWMDDCSSIVNDHTE